MLTFHAVERLVKKGDIASLRQELDRGLDANLSNFFSETLLMLAAREGHVRIGELLVSKGAEVDATNDAGDTALSLAAQKGHSSFVRILLAHGASTEVHPQDCNLEEYLRRASGLSKEKIASVLDLLSDDTDGKIH